MSKKSTTAAFILTSLISSAVLSDQAAYITPAEANRALDLLDNVIKIKSYCAPCSGDVPKIMPVDQIEAVDVNYEGYWEVQVNGVGIDLAYTYIPYNDQWQNLAMALRIPVQDVPEFID